MNRLTKLLVGSALMFGTSAAYAIDVPEVEANETKAQATVTPALNAGDTLSGSSTGSSTTAPGPASADTFRVNMNGGALGIYRHRLVNTGGTTHGASIRGLNQTDPGVGFGGVAGTTDSTAQSTSTATTPPRFVQWYGFGKQESLYFRVTGATTTTAPYQWTLESQPVTPVDIGSYAPGLIQITTVGQGHSSDTDMWVYDGALQAIPGYGNDDESVDEGGTGASLQSQLRRTYAPGTYYIALTNFNLASSATSPDTDDFETGTLLDFDDVVLNSSTTANLNMAFTISDSGGASLQVANTKAGAFDINWFKFTVTPEPSALALLAIGGIAFFRRR